MTQLRVLIAEDDYVSAALLEHLVREEGHQVCGTVRKGAEVPDFVERLAPDVVLMDVHLADEVSGISATRSLLRRFSVPVIVVSATDSADDLRAIAESGALGFMKKPVSGDELKVSLLLVTRHHTALRKIRESEVLHRSLFDYAAVGIYVCHKDGYFLTSNMAFARMLGYSGPGEILRLVRSADEQIYADQGRRGQLLAELSAGREIRGAESRVYGRDGDLLWVSEHLVPTLDEEGNLEHYEGVVINISDRKRAEAERGLAFSMLQNTVDAIADLVAVTDLQGNVIFSNKSFQEKAAALPDPGQLANIRPGRDGDDLFTRFLRHLDEPGREARVVRGLLRLAGPAEPLDTSISPFYGPDDQVMGAVFVMRPGA